MSRFKEYFHVTNCFIAVCLDSFAAAPPLEGALAPNSRLSGMELLMEDAVVGPESTAEWRGAVYTGSAGGRIVRVTSEGGGTTVARLGKCGERRRRQPPVPVLGNRTRRINGSSGETSDCQWPVPSGLFPAPDLLKYCENNDPKLF